MCLEDMELGTVISFLIHLMRKEYFNDLWKLDSPVPNASTSPSGGVPLGVKVGVPIAIIVVAVVVIVAVVHWWKRRRGPFSFGEL